MTGYIAHVYNSSGKEIARINGTGAFIMSEDGVKITAEDPINLALTWQNSYIYSYDSGMNWVRYSNCVNAIFTKFLTILKLQPNRATLRSDPTQAVRYMVRSSGFVAAFLFTGIFQADKPRECEGRALVSRQAANLSSKNIMN